jgi:hypothetical protein
VPAAAGTPAPIAYVNAAAVKELVAGHRPRRGGSPEGDTSPFRAQWRGRVGWGPGPRCHAFPNGLRLGSVSLVRPLRLLGRAAVRVLGRWVGVGATLLPASFLPARGPMPGSGSGSGSGFGPAGSGLASARVLPAVPFDFRAAPAPVSLRKLECSEQAAQARTGVHGTNPTVPARSLQSASGAGSRVDGDGRGHWYRDVRGEIQGSSRDRRLRKHLPRTFPSAENESRRLEGDQIPP